MRSTYPTVYFKSGECVWVTYAKQKVFKQNNCINLVATGTPGCGKSWALLSYFCLLNPDFELEGNFFFRAKDLLNSLKQGNFKSGKIWGFDEAGIDANNLNYYDVINKGLNALFQTARHRNYIFGLSVPFINYLSKGVRTLMTAQWECKGWTKNNETIVFPRVMEYNGEVDKFYKKRLVVVKDADYLFCDRLLLPKPPKKIVREYERYKKEFTQDLYNRVYDDIVRFEDKASAKANAKLLSEREEVCLHYLKEGFGVPKIMEAMNVTRSFVYRLMRGINSKGVTIKGVKGDNNEILSYTVQDLRGS